MAQFTKRLSAGGNQYDLILDVNQSSQSIANNTSAVSWSLWIRKNSGSGYSASDTKNWSVNIGGQTKSGTIAGYNFSGKSSIGLDSGSFTIAHNSDGTKSISASGTFTDSGVTGIGSGTASGSLTLTTIPRTSTFTIPSSFTVGSAFTVSISRASSSFTHAVELWDGGTNIYASGNTVGTSLSPNIDANTLIVRMSNVASKTFTVHVDTYVGSTYIGKQTKNITANIPASNITISDPKRPMGGTAVRIYTNSISDNLTYAVSYRSRAGVWTAIAAKSRFAYVDFVIPLDFAYAIPNGVETPVRLVLETYNGTQSLGYSFINVIGQIPADIVPTFSAVAVSENESLVASLVGAYVQTKSRLNLAITGASGTYGSTIRSYNITGVGRNVNSSSTVTDYLSVSGNQTITGTVTDSRGRTFEKSIVVNILPYTAPTLSDLSFRRTLPDKTEAPLGDNVTVSASVKVQSLIVNGVEKNSIWYHVQSAQSGGSFADKINITYAGLVAGYTNVWVGYSVDHSYNFRVRVGDVFGFGGWSVGVVPTGIVTQQWGSKTTSFGKMIDNTNYNVQVGTGGIQNDGPIVGGQRYATIFDKSTDNLNDVTDEWVVAGTATQNGTGTYSYVQTIMYSNSNQRKQIAWGYNNDLQHTRWLFGGNWSSWKRDVSADAAHLLNMIYPVGSIYMSTTNTSPSTFLGGTWAVWGAGRVPVGVDTSQTEFNTPNKTGGAKTHTLTVDEMPAHGHSGSTSIGYGAGGPTSNLRLDANGGLNRAALITNSTGGGKSHNNLQPFITAYMWRRTA